MKSCADFFANGGRGFALSGKKQAFARQRGMALVVVLMLLVIVSLLGVAAMQITRLAERSARNDRDMQVAWQSAEAALLDAETDINGGAGKTKEKGQGRGDFFRSTQIRYINGCGSKQDGELLIGLCETNITGKPAWLSVDFEDDSGNARTVALGTYTQRHFAAGSSAASFVGVQPSRQPRYVIEPITDPLLCTDLSKICGDKVYRITSMGFGPRPDIQAVIQGIYRN